MTVKKKMIGNALFTALGIVFIVAIGTYGILKIKASLDSLTAKATPLEVKTLELQQTIERLSADFLRLGMSTDSAEVERISGRINDHIKSFETTKADIERLDKNASVADTGVFKNIHKTIIQSVQERLKDMALFKTESANVGDALKKEDEAITGIKNSITGLNTNAENALRDAQQLNLRLNGTIKKLYIIQGRIKDMGAVAGEVETIKNRFKLNPVKERLKALADSVQNVEYEKGDPPIIKEVKDISQGLYEKITREGSGLVALRADILKGQDVEGQYLNLKSDILNAIDTLNAKISETIDSYELQVVQDRQNVERSMDFQKSANQITGIGSSLSIDVKELDAKMRLIMLSASDAELDRISSDTRRIEDQMLKDGERMKKVLVQMGQTAIAKSADVLPGLVRRVQGSMTNILGAKRSVLESDAAMLKTIDMIKNVTKEQSSHGEEQVRNITQKQEEVVSGVNSSVRGSLTLMLVLSGIIILITFVLNWRTIGSVSGPLKNTEEMIRNIASSEGDLTKRLKVESADEIGLICESFNVLVEKLHKSVSTVSEKTNAVSSSAHELSATAEELSQRANMQASEVNTLSTAAEEMSTTLQDVVENAHSTASFAKETETIATDGSKVVVQAAEGIKNVSVTVKNAAEIIENLSHKSEKIGEIVSVIKDIADQTNLLALNAAIESARAGEQGRGFAVVADEVRKLAERTAAATTEITDMITAIQSESEKAVVAMRRGLHDVDSAVSYAHTAGEALHKIVESIDREVEMVAHIATASHEQLSTIESITASIRGISNVAADFASGMAQTTQTAGDLERVSAELQNVVKEFKI